MLYNRLLQYVQSEEATIVQKTPTSCLLPSLPDLTLAPKVISGQAGTSTEDSGAITLYNDNNVEQDRDTAQLTATAPLLQQLPLLSCCQPLA